MAFTADSTIGEVLGGRPNAKAIIEKHIGRLVSESEIGMAMGMSLAFVAGYVGMSQEKLTALIKELNS